MIYKKLHTYSASGELRSPCWGELCVGLTGNNKTGMQMLIKARYFREELVRLDCPVRPTQGRAIGKVEPVVAQDCLLLSSAPSKGISKRQLPRVRGGDQSRNGNGSSRHCALPSLPMFLYLTGSRRNRIVCPCLSCFYGVK